MLNLRLSIREIGWNYWFQWSVFLPTGDNAARNSPQFWLACATRISTGRYRYVSLLSWKMTATSITILRHDSFEILASELTAAAIILQVSHKVFYSCPFESRERS